MATASRKRRCRRCEMIRLGLVVTTLMICAMLLSTASQAADWLKSGADLLRQYDAATGSESGRLGAGLPLEDVQSGLLEALRTGTEKVVAQLSQADGFNADPRVHIPLPPMVAQAAGLLGKAGFGAIGDDLELRLNRAAEASMPEARALFLDAIRNMSIEDARGLLNGPDNAATEYFRGQMSAPLAEKMRPIVDQSLAEVGALQVYEQFVGQYQQMPLVPNLRTDLQQHVLERGIAGLFDLVAIEEAAIRADPAARSTELLKKVFGSGS